MQLGDTICAISSSLAPAARIIVRLSGPEAIRLALRIASLDPDRAVSRLTITVANCSFPAWIYIFRAPRSVTAEDVVELHLPGNVLLARWTVDALLKLGARQAEPGEFTARAYFNGRLDLSQAEGVAAAVSAHSASELAAARQLLAGELSRRLRPLMEEIAHTLALVEAGIDFTDEDISFISAADAKSRIESVIDKLSLLISESSRFEPLAHWPAVVLVGRPNAGKSTLLNALAGHERAVVSPIAGTTRDVLSATVNLQRGSIQLFDVAGFESTPAEAGSNPMTQVSSDMQRRAWMTLEAADHVILVVAADDDVPMIPLPRVPDLILRTKADLHAHSDPLAVSALTGRGMDSFRQRLDELVFSRTTGSSLALNARHIACVEAAIESLQHAKPAVNAGPEILALELRQALDALGRVLGEVTPDDVLGRIFSTFCIGK